MNFQITTDELIDSILNKILFRLVDENYIICEGSDHEHPYRNLDVINTQIMDETCPLLNLNFLTIPKLSTLANAYIINELVKYMGIGNYYLNIGTWCGYSLFAGAIGNLNKICIGVDSFKIPDRVFATNIIHQLINSYQYPHVQLYEIDYIDYFENYHNDRPIGVYFYDGDHEYKHQINGLALADEFIVDGGYILIDDINDKPVHSSIIDFLEDHNNYKIVLNKQTANCGHPTYWNGLIVLRKDK